MKWTALIAALALTASQAQALSCKRPNLAESFNRFAQAEETYRIAVGSVAIKSAIPKYQNGKPRTAKAALTAQFLGLNGLTEIRSEKITVQTGCVAHWCGGFPNQSGQFILFLRQTEGGMVLDMPACPSGGFTNYSKDRLSLLQKCLRRGSCSKADVRAMEFK